MTSEPKNTSVSNSLKQILGVVVFVLVSIGIVGGVAAAILAEKVVPQTLVSNAFGFGILAALLAKRKKKSPLLWFFVGFLGAGLAVEFLIGFARGLVH